MTKPSRAKPASGKTGPAGPGRTGEAKAAAKATPTKAPLTKQGASKAGSGSPKPMSAEARRIQSKKIVNKRQTPWALIIGTLVIVALAIGVVGYAVSKSNKKNSAAPATTTAAADKIPGIAHYTGLSRNHVSGVITYPQSPPVGGNHSPVWADCNGVIYPSQIANENAVHPLEHGAVWITYRPGIDQTDLDNLTKYVAGQQYIFMTPYAGLKTKFSLQAWGYQLFLDSTTDPRIKQFITDLRLNQTNTPELGASCDSPDATFEKTPSTPGHPIDS